MWNYSEKVKDHFFNPRNSGVLEGANGVGDVGSISCGDALRLMIHVDPDSNVITDARFQTFGCGSAIASSSALTELIIGKTVAEAQAITNRDIADYLDGLPPEKMHCSVMGAEALRAAIANYRGETLAEDDHEEGALICRCFGVTADVIERAVRVNGLTTLDQVVNFTKAGGACKTCHEQIEEVLGETLASVSREQAAAAAMAPAADQNSIQVTPPAPPAPPVVSGATGADGAGQGARKLSTRQKLQLIESTVETLRAAARRDGGDIELVDIDDNTVYVNLSGACRGCAMSSATISWLKEKLIEATGYPIRVIPADARV